jgi:hypothetical protein
VNALTLWVSLQTIVMTTFNLVSQKRAKELSSLQEDQHHVAAITARETTQLLLEGLVITAFIFECHVKLGDGTNPPATGFSLNYASAEDPVVHSILSGGDGDGFAGSQDNGGEEDNLREEGTLTGLGIGFDLGQATGRRTWVASVSASTAARDTRSRCRICSSISLMGIPVLAVHWKRAGVAPVPVPTSRGNRSGSRSNG